MRAATGTAGQPGDPREQLSDCFIERRRGDRRKKRFNFVLRERRRGFDRRALPGGRPPTLLYRAQVYLRSHPQVLLILLLVLNLLSALDFFFTLDALAKGAHEANPVMRELLGQSVWLAGVVKLMLVASASAIIWRLRSYRPLLGASVFALLFFTVLLGYQLFGFLIL